MVLVMWQKTERMQKIFSFMIVLAVLGISAATPSQVLATDADVAAYRCEFTRECLTGQACTDYEPNVMQFLRDAKDINLWTLAPAGEQPFVFTRLPFETEDLHAFVSTSVDPGASAVSLLTVFDDGQAILSIHGVFFSPGSVTHLGTCVPKDG